MTDTDLATRYRAYIDCLNRQDWPALGEYVSDNVIHNDRPLGLAGYRAMLEQDFRDIPDLRFDIRLLVCEPPRIYAGCASPVRRAGRSWAAVDGRKVTFCENVFYEFHDGKIRQVWSVIDKAAIEAQL